VDLKAVGLYVATAMALLGSPGPGIAALLSIGKSRGWRQGLKYFAGLLLGLSSTALATAGGLIAILALYPSVMRAMIIASTGYLLYLAWAIAASPVGVTVGERAASHSPLAGFLLGITNPKAYIAFGSLLASPLRIFAVERFDLAIKVILIIAVIIIVDIAWLWFGVKLGQVKISPTSERAMNLIMGAIILFASALAFV
jgi:threonine/homoserine/homoserine lactone efflux protein